MIANTSIPTLFQYHCETCYYRKRPDPTGFLDRPLYEPASHSHHQHPCLLLQPKQPERKCVDTRAAGVVGMETRLRKRHPARQMRLRPDLPTVDRKIGRQSLLMGLPTDGLPEVLRLPLEVSYQVTVLPGPTIHAEDLAIKLHRHSHEIKGSCKNIDRATEESSAHLVLLHTGFGTSLELSAIFLFQAHMFARKTNESAQCTRYAEYRPKRGSKTLPVVETLTEENIGDGLTRPHPA